MQSRQCCCNGAIARWAAASWHELNVVQIRFDGAVSQNFVNYCRSCWEEILNNFLLRSRVSMSCEMVIVKGLKYIKFERLAWIERAHDACNFVKNALRDHVIVKLVYHCNFSLGLWQNHSYTLIKNRSISVCSHKINTWDRGPVKIFAKWVLVCNF